MLKTLTHQSLVKVYADIFAVQLDLHCIPISQFVTLCLDMIAFITVISIINISKIQNYYYY